MDGLKVPVEDLREPPRVLFRGGDYLGVGERPQPSPLPNHALAQSLVLGSRFRFRISYPLDGARPRQQLLSPHMEQAMGTDLEQAKARTKRAWSEGDYTRVARFLDPAAEALVRSCSISAGDLILDVAAGNGNAAVHAAGTGARIVASDLTRAQVQLGRARSLSEGLSIHWVVADAEELPFPDARFDSAMSVFGAMFAPRPDVVASELFRVLKPGGTLGMANWTPEGYIGQSAAISSAYIEPAKDLPSPLDWGTEDIVRARLSTHARSIELEMRSLTWEFPSVAAARAFFDENFGPTLAARRALPPERFEAMREEQRAVIRDWAGGDGPVAIDAAYLQIVARKREGS